MTELSRQILEKYQVRKTYQQKTDFINLLKEHFPKLSLQEFSFFKGRNIIVGDIESAEIILTAHYDTCAQLPFPNFIAPKSPLLSILYSLLPIAVILTIILLVNIVLGFFIHHLLIHQLVSFALYFGLILLMFAGPANQHTANDNTSGVIVLCELLRTLNEASKDKVAFVFFDHEESGLIGSSLFRKKYKKQIKHKLLINFDCVSDGDHILVSANKGARTKYGNSLKNAFLPTDEKSILFTNAESTYYPSDQAGFPNAVAVSVLKRKLLIGYYLDRIHTSKDTIFKTENIAHICNCMLQLLKQL